MELTKAKIEEFKDEIEGLTGYNLIVEEIKENLPKNPDISIESCKSLIEGLSKKSLELLSTTYQESKKFRDKCNNKLPFLIQSAFDEVYAFNVIKEQHKSLYKVISDKVILQRITDKRNIAFKADMQNAVKKVAAIRHDRGDISHGRIYPKPIESELHLANSIKSITDGICSFMIHELAIQYKVKQEQDKKLIYKDEDDYNEWLDDQNDNLITKIDFSRLLFDNSYEKYKDIYFGEYQDHLDTLEDDDADDSADTQPVQPVQREVENLINTFKEEDFWTEERLRQLEVYTTAGKFKLQESKKVIEDFLFTGKDPLPDEAIKILEVRPSLKDRKKSSDDAILDIKKIAGLLKAIKE